MPDTGTVVSIVSLVTSLLAALGAAASAGWVTLRTAEQRERLEGERLVSRYRDPIYLAARDLEDRIGNLLRGGVLHYAEYSQDHVDTLYVGTSFAFGQYLAWTYILRRRIQFVRFATGQRDTKFSNLMQDIVKALHNSSTASPFLLWRGFQSAIGELMCERDPDGELVCIGYATFYDRYKEDARFRKWFGPIDAGLDELVAAKKRGRRDGWEEVGAGGGAVEQSGGAVGSGRTTGARACGASVVRM